jgi:hypothetical protein
MLLRIDHAACASLFHSTRQRAAETLLPAHLELLRQHVDGVTKFSISYVSIYCLCDLALRKPAVLLSVACHRICSQA